MARINRDAALPPGSSRKPRTPVHERVGFVCKVVVVAMTLTFGLLVLLTQVISLFGATGVIGAVSEARSSCSLGEAGGTLSLILNAGASFSLCAALYILALAAFTFSFAALNYKAYLLVCRALKLSSPLVLSTGVFLLLNESVMIQLCRLALSLGVSRGGG